MSPEAMLIAPVADVAPTNIGRPVTEYAPCGLEILSDELPLVLGDKLNASFAVKVEPAPPLLADPWTTAWLQRKLPGMSKGSRKKKIPST